MSEPRFKHLILTSGERAPVVDAAQYQPTHDQRRYFVLDLDRRAACEAILGVIYGKPHDEA